MNFGNTAAATWTVTDLKPDLVVAATRPMPELPPGVWAVVASIREQERRARPRLFNGAVFSADSVGSGRIEGHWTGYRRVLAQMRVNSLFETLGIRALAINGLLECADGLVLGRREAGSVYQPGCWQSPPAGSVERRSGSADASDRIDLPGQVLAECEEELGLADGDIVVLKPVVAVEHPGSHVGDIGLLLRTPRAFTEVEAAWRRHGNHEYDRLGLLGIDATESRLPESHEVLPTTNALIAAWLRNRKMT